MSDKLQFVVSACRWSRWSIYRAGEDAGAPSHLCSSTSQQRQIHVFGQAPTISSGQFVLIVSRLRRVA